MFVGDLEIVSEEPIGDKVKVSYKDGSWNLFSKEWRDYLVSDKEDKEIRAKKSYKIAAAMLEMIKDGDLNNFEVEDLLETVKASVVNANENAICEAFWVTHPRFIPFSRIHESSVAYVKKNS